MKNLFKNMTLDRGIVLVSMPAIIALAVSAWIQANTLGELHGALDDEVPGLGREIQQLSLQHSALAAQMVRDVTAQGLANTLWAMTRTDMQIPDDREALCLAVARKVQDFKAPEIGSALWAMARTETPMTGLEALCKAAVHAGPRLPDVFEALCVTVIETVRDFHRGGR